MKPAERKKLLKRLGFVPGLIFAWRVRSLGNWGRLFFAGFITMAGFGSAAMLVNVKTGEGAARGDEQGSANVVMIYPDDVASRELLEWAREQSPFPDRWEPAEPESVEEIIAAVDEELYQSSRYEPKLRPDQELGEELAGVDVLNLWGTDLPRVLTKSRPEEGYEIAREIKVVTVPDDALAARWKELEVSWEGTDYYHLVGREAKFVLGVEESGEVVFCLAVDGLGPVFDQELQTWLRGHVLEAEDEGELVWGQVVIRILAAEFEAEVPSGDEAQTIDKEGSDG